MNLKIEKEEEGNIKIVCDHCDRAIEPHHYRVEAVCPHHDPDTHPTHKGLQWYYCGPTCLMLHLIDNIVDGPDVIQHIGEEWRPVLKNLHDQMMKLQNEGKL